MNTDFTFKIAPVDDYNGSYVQGKSRVQIYLEVKLAAGTLVKSTSIVIDTGETFVGTGTHRSGIQTVTGQHTVTATVIDSKGYEKTKSLTYHVLAYSDPKILKFTASRCRSDGELADEGTSIKVDASYSVSGIGDKDANIIIDISEDNGLTWSEVAFKTGKSGTWSTVLTNQAPEDGRQIVKLRVYDDISSAEKTVEIGPSGVFISYDGDDQSFAFGRYVTAADSGKLISALDFVSESVLSIAGTMTLSTDAKKVLVDLIHPVGTVIWLSSDKNPNTIYEGTTWKQYRSVFRSMKHTGFVIDYQNGTTTPTAGRAVQLNSWNGTDSQKWSHALSPSVNGATNTEQVSTLPWLRTA